MGGLTIDWEHGVAYLDVALGKVHETVEILPNKVLVDNDKNGRLLGIEFLDLEMFTPTTTSGTASSAPVITTPKDGE